MWHYQLFNFILLSPIVGPLMDVGQAGSSHADKHWVRVGLVWPVFKIGWTMAHSNLSTVLVFTLPNPFPTLLKMIRRHGFLGGEVSCDHSLGLSIEGRWEP